MQGSVEKHRIYEGEGKLAGRWRRHRCHRLQGAGDATQGQTTFGKYFFVNFNKLIYLKSHLRFIKKYVYVVAGSGEIHRE